MAADFYECAVTMPRWEASDPFGRGAIRKARWEYTQIRRERDSLKNELKAIYDERGKAVNMLVEALHVEQKRVEELSRMLKSGDDARKSLGEKLSAALNDRADFEKSNKEWADKFEKLLAKYQQLEMDHETVLRSLTDGGAVE